METTRAPKKSYDTAAAKKALEQMGLKASAKNIKTIVERSPDLDGNKAYADSLELTLAAQRLAAELSDGVKVKVTAPIDKEIGKVNVQGYSIAYDEATCVLSFKPASGGSPHGLRAMASPINVGHGPDGSVRITLGEDTPLKMEKGKWVKATLAAVVKERKLGADDLKRLEAAGYNLHALRDWFVVKTEDGKSHFFALRDLRVDKEGDGDHESDDPTRMASHPGFMPPMSHTPDLKHGLLAFSEACTDIHIIGFQDGKPLITIKKPVVYLYPERPTRVRLTVETAARFIAKYPDVPEATWDLVAAPNGVLFDPKTERKYGYVFWEAESPKNLAIDPARAFRVSAAETEAFLERAALRLGLNDREKTDFISYWIAPMKRNPVNLVQFLVGAECDAYARMTIEPKPDSVIRVFMLFERAEDAVSVGAPELPEIRRTGFTAVEWGGVDLDERTLGAS